MCWTSTVGARLNGSAISRTVKSHGSRHAGASQKASEATPKSHWTACATTTKPFARSMARPKKDAKAAFNPPRKQVRTGIDPENYNTQTPVWQLRKIDHGGKWS